jgi:hypothetical protein
VSRVGRDRDRLGQLTQAGTAAAAGAAIEAVAPGLGVPSAAVSAVAKPVISAAVRAVWNRWREHQEHQVIELLRLAAKWADITQDELAYRLQASPELEALFIQTVRAAVGTGSLQKLVALAVSLGDAAADEPEPIQWERTFVAVVDGLDPEHFEVLRLFVLSAAENNLGDSTEPMHALNTVQLRHILPGWTDLLDPLVSALVSAGLLAPVGEPIFVTTAIGTELNTTWHLTEFGAALVERLEVVRQYLASSLAVDPATSPVP